VQKKNSRTHAVLNLQWSVAIHKIVVGPEAQSSWESSRLHTHQGFWPVNEGSRTLQFREGTSAALSKSFHNRANSGTNLSVTMNSNGKETMPKVQLRSRSRGSDGLGWSGSSVISFERLRFHLWRIACQLIMRTTILL